jgi:hypothetical protein
MDHHMPAPVEPRLVWFVREPFPSVVTGTAMDHGAVEKGDELVVVSEMGEGGVVFADGIEHDAIPFLDGRTVTVRVSSRLLRLVGGRGEGTANPTAAGSGVLGGHGGRGGKRRGHPER